MAYCIQYNDEKAKFWHNMNLAFIPALLLVAAIILRFQYPQVGENLRNILLPQTAIEAFSDASGLHGAISVIYTDIFYP